MIDTNERFSDNLTEQKVFDLCVYHLGTMQEQSIIIDVVDPAASVCQYRKRDSNTCAVGYFLSDEEYSPEMESHSVNSMCGMFPQRLRPFRNLLSQLQRIHDESLYWDGNRKGMRDSLRMVAIQNNLIADVIESPEMQWNKEVVS